MSNAIRKDKEWDRGSSRSRKEDLWPGINPIIFVLFHPFAGHTKCQGVREGGRQASSIISILYSSLLFKTPKVWISSSIRPIYKELSLKENFISIFSFLISGLGAYLLSPLDRLLGQLRVQINPENVVLSPPNVYFGQTRYSCHHICFPTGRIIQLTTLSPDSNPLSIIQSENLLLYQPHKQNEIQFKKSAHNIYN